MGDWLKIKCLMSGAGEITRVAKKKVNVVFTIYSLESILSFEKGL